MVEFFSRNDAETQRRYEELARSDPLGGGKDTTYGAIDFRSAIACLKIHSGEKTVSRQLLKQIIADANQKLQMAPDDAATLYRLSAAEAMLGDTDKSLQHFKAAVADGWIDYRSAQLDPRFDNISSTPEFRKTVSDLATKTARLGRQSSTALPTTN